MSAGPPIVGHYAARFAGMDPASVECWDIIPDIHGMARKLEGLLGGIRKDRLFRRLGADLGASRSGAEGDR